MPVTSSSQKRLINFELQCTLGRDGKKRKHLGVQPYPPSNIERKIKEYDPEIEIWFNRIWGKWMLFRRGHVVMTIQNEDRSYRPLDHRVLHALRKADAHNRGMKVLDEILEHNENLEASREKEFSDFVTESSKETRKLFRDQMDMQVGAINLPKEDLVIPEKEVLEKQREKREARRPKNYKKQDVGVMTKEL